MDWLKDDVPRKNSPANSSYAEHNLPYR